MNVKVRLHEIELARFHIFLAFQNVVSVVTQMLHGVLDVSKDDVSLHGHQLLHEDKVLEVGDALKLLARLVGLSTATLDDFE